MVNQKKCQRITSGKDILIIMEQKRFMLTYPQKNIMGLEQFYKDTNINNITSYVVIDSAYIDGVVSAIHLFVENTPTIRTVIENADSEIKEIYQRIRDYTDFDVQILHFASDNCAEYLAYMDDFAAKPLNISACMYDFKIAVFDDNTALLISKLHHLISDAWTQLSLNETIVKNSRVLTNGEGELIQLGSYSDYIENEKKYLEGKRFSSDKEYWGNILSKPFSPASPRAMAVSTSPFAERLTIKLDSEKMLLINQLCGQEKISVYALFMALLFTYSARIQQTDRIAVGTIVLNRSGNAEKHMMGVFINTIPVVLDLDKGDTFIKICQKVTSVSTANFRHQKFPFAYMQDTARNENGISTAMFDVLFSYQNAASNEHTENWNWYFNKIAQQQLSVHVDDRCEEGILTVNIDYLTALYTKEEVAYITDSLFEILQDAVKNPEKAYTELSIIGDNERYKLLNSFNATTSEMSTDGIGALSSMSALAMQDKMAVIAADGALSYIELEAASNKAANALINMGIGRGDIVALMLPRNKSLMPVILGILKAGAAYLPIDGDYPKDRISYILEDSNAKYIVAENKSDYQNSILAEELLSFDNANFPNVTVQPDDLCYLIYTSGSTGKPKGTMLTHKNVANYCSENSNNVMGKIIKSKDSIIVSVTTISFDIFVTESLLPLINGMTVLLADERQSSDPVEFNHLICNNHADFLQTTPSKMGILMSERENLRFLSVLKGIILGGEPFDISVAAKIKKYSDAEIYNIYGPTETTVWSTISDKITDTEHISIGRPVANTQIYIVDTNMKLLPTGIAGELCIGGDGVCAGYYKRDELTNEKFIENPFANGRIYRTGDYAKWNIRGELEFLGRADSQIKLHGLRIELGEIESCIHNFYGIESAAAVIRGEEKNRYICAFFTANEPVDTVALKGHLALSLTAYMIPNALVQLEKMPYTNNGKIDRKALPSVVITEEKTPFTTPVQIKLFDIISEILGSDNFGASSDLFTAGMTSLSAIRINSAIRKEWGVALSVKDVMRNNTVLMLETLLIKADTSEEQKYELRDYYPLTQNQMGIYLEYLKDKSALNYNMSAAYRFSNNINAKKLAAAFNAAISAHPYMNSYIKEIDGQPMIARNDSFIPNIKVKKVKDDTINTSFMHSFDLTKPVLYRALICESDTSVYLYFDIHHIIFDGDSAALFMQSVVRAYEGENLYAELHTAYDYALYEERKLALDKDKYKSFYSDSFYGVTEASKLPIELHGMPKSVSTINRPLDNSLLCRVNDFARSMKATPNNVFMAAFYYVISVFSGMKDVVIGTVENGRSNAISEAAVGMFVKTLPLYAKIMDSLTVMELIRNSREYLIEAISSDLYPYTAFTDEFKLYPEILYIYQNIDFSAFSLAGEKGEVFPMQLEDAKFPVSFSVNRGNIQIEYRSDLYSENLITRLLDAFILCTDKMMADSSACIADIELISAEDLEMFARLNATKVQYDERLTVCRIFEQCVKENPHNDAVICGDVIYTYEGFDLKAAAIAAGLAQRGVKAGDIVAFALPRTAELLCAIFGIIKAGAAFLPMDIQWPADRIAYAVDNSGAKLLIDENVLEELLLCNPYDYREVKVRDDDPLYVIYTSGSTGTPKGVIITQKNVANFSQPFEYNYLAKEINRNCTNVLGLCTVAFDISTSEYFPALLGGKCVSLADENTIDSPDRLAEYMMKTGVDCMQITPSRLVQYLEFESFSNAVKRIKVLMVAAETFPSALAEKLMSITDAIILNGYGPSETTMASSYAYVKSGNITIGKPISNVQYYVLDENLNRLPVGVTGELCITGYGVGNGYIGNKALTDEKFVKNPFGEGKLYHSGDYARLGYDGEIEFFGRMDNLIKLHGLRIEIGEIESLISEYEYITACSVIVSGEGEKAFLCGYYTASEPVDSKELQEYLRSKLTYYMVPSILMQIETMPVTMNGKVNRKALPAIEFNEEIVPCSNPVQEKLYAIISDALKTDSFGITTDLFRLGMTSLSAIYINSRILKEFGVSYSSMEILKSHTIEKLEVLVSTAEAVSYKSHKKQELYPLTQVQTGLYLEYLKDSTALTYNIPVVYRFNKGLDLLRLKEAVGAAISAHSYINSYFTDENGEIKLARNDDFVPDIKIKKVKDAGNINFVKPFDLTKPALYRIALYEDNQSVYIYFDIHHIIFDGESMLIFFEDIKKAYEGKKLKAEKYTAFDYALDEAALRTKSVYIKSREYITAQFSGAEKASEIGADNNLSDCPAKSVHREIDSGLLAKIADFSKKCGVTPSSVYLAAFEITISKYQNSNDVIIGTVENGRDNPCLLNHVGMMVKTLPLRTEIVSDETVVEFVKKSGDNLYKMIENSAYSFAEFTSERKINPRILFVYQNRNTPKFTLDGTDGEITVYDTNSEAKAKFPIVLSVADDSLVLEYDSGLYYEDTITGLLDSCYSCLSDIVCAPEKSLSKVSVLSKEQKLILNSFNATDADFSQTATIVSVFEEQAANTPNALAVIASDESLTYDKLNAQANRIAHALCDRGIGTGDIIAFRLSRSSKLLCVILGIMKAGAAYLPIDISYPDERVKNILDDSKAVILIDDSSADELMAHDNSQNMNLPLTGNDLCYIIYTSGSTGKPKGVMTEHRNVLNYALPLEFNKHIITIKNNCSVSLAVGSIVFDIAVAEIYPFLFSGKTVLLADDSQVNDSVSLGKLVVEHKADAILCTPSRMLQYLEDEGFAAAIKQFKSITAAGEAVPVSWVNKLRAITDSKLYNGYGPTETTAGSTFLEINDDYVNIGKPLSNEQIYIVDRVGNELPVGIYGELCIAGKGVSRGYLFREELTAEKFPKNPFGEGKIYHTGDLARWNIRGEIEFIGRIDNQIKYHGYRIELGEIEAAICGYSAISESAVILQNDGKRQQLCGFFTAFEPVDVIVLKEHLAKTLAHYMIPGKFTQLSAMPLNLNNKIDRKALSEMADTDHVSFDDYLEPISKTQKTLCKIWADTLNIKKVGINDNFFEIGGDSLISIKLVAILSRAGITLSAGDILKHPTIAELSELVDKNEVHTLTKNEQGILSGTFKLHPIQSWFLEQKFENSDHFNQSLLFETARRLTAPLVKKTLELIVEMQDVLRLKLSGKDTQRYLKSVDLRFISLAEIEDINGILVAEECRHSLSNGSMFNTVLFENKGRQYLFVSVHHFAVDGVSWDIFVRMFEDYYSRLAYGEKVKLQTKTASYRQYVEKLYEFAENIPESTERYWSSLETNRGQLPVNKNYKPALYSAAKNITLKLNKDETSKLTKNAPSFFSAKVNEIMLAALVLSVKKITGQTALTVKLEGHGREDIGGNMDTSSTMGWFTSFYPAVLDIGASDDIFRAVDCVKMQLSVIPDNGLSYSVMKYINGRSDLTMPVGISFNYLGNTSDGNRSNALLKTANIQSDTAISPENHMLDGISINAVVMNSSLKLSIDYDTNAFKNTFVKELSENLLKTLKGMTSISVSGAREQYPLLKSQMGIYLSCMLSPETLSYNEPSEYILSGRVDMNRLKDSFVAAVNAHPFMKAKFIEKDGEILQCVNSEAEVNIPVFTRTEAEYEQYKMNFVRSFKLGDGSLYRIELNQVGDKIKVLFDIHHIIYDRTSAAVILDSVKRAYAGESLAKEQYSCFDAAAFEVGASASQKYLEDKQFFTERFRGLEAQTDLPVDLFPECRMDAETFARQYKAKTSTAFYDSVSRFGRENSVTGNAVFLSALNLCLSCYTNSDDVILGTVSSGRDSAKIFNSVGMFVKTFPLYTKIDWSLTIPDFVMSIQDDLMTTISHGLYSFSELVNDISAVRKNDKNPVFDILYVYQNTGDAAASFEGEEIIVSELKKDDLKFDITLMVVPLNDSFEIVADYNGKLYSAETIKRFIDTWLLGIEKILSAKDNRLSDINVASEADIKLIAQFNDTAMDYDSSIFVPQIIEKIAESSPNKVIAIDIDGSLTCDEFNTMANKIANGLLRQGLNPNDAVALLLPRNKMFVCTMLGVVKTRGAYLPIATDYPLSRIEYMLKDAGVRFIITTSDKMELYNFDGRFTGKILDINELLSNALTGNPNQKIQADDLFCLLHTSGSTGKPKCAMLTQGSLTSFVQCNKYQLENVSQSIATVAYTFDAFTMETLFPMSNGLPVVVAAEDEYLNYNKLEALFERYPNSYWFATPTRIKELLLNCKNKSLFKDYSTLFVGGEALTKEIFTLMKSSSPNAKILNVYGPTETTFIVTTKQIDTVEDINLGRALPNLQIHVLDSKLRQLPVGALGEMYISGNGVGTGYRNNPELTAERFIDNPFGKGKMYRTGDIARWDISGNIDFIGRLDFQVKLHGQRIELMEIESCINSFEQVTSSAVVIKERDTEKYLCGFFTASMPVDTKELREHLAENLTYYMVPNILKQLDKMPMTPSGKLSRTALQSDEYDVKPEAEITACITDLQFKLHDIVTEIIGTEKIGLTSDLFMFGMTSLSAIRINTKISTELGFELKTKDILKNPSIEKIEALILLADKNTGEFTAPAAKREYYPLTNNQLGLYLEYEKDPNALTYNIPVIYRFGKGIDVNRLKSAFEAALKAHSYLNTYLKEINGEIVQVRNDLAEQDIPVIKSNETEFNRIKESFASPFDLFKAPLYRIKIVETESFVYILFDIHHIIFDGDSSALFMESVKKAYAGEMLKNEAYTCFELALEEQGKLSSDEYNQAHDYFVNQLKYIDSVTSLEADIKSNMSESNVNAAYVHHEITQKLDDKIKGFGRRNGVTVNNIYLSAFCMVLSRFTNSDYTSMAVISSGRNDARYSVNTGMMVKTMPFCQHLLQDKAIKDFVKETQNKMIETIENDIFPYSEIVSECRLNMDIMFAYQNQDMSEIIIDGQPAEVIPLSINKAKFPLSFIVSGRRIEVEYRNDMYSGKLMETLIFAVLNCIDGMISNENGKISALSTAGEQDIITLNQFNDRYDDYDRSRTISNLFEEVALAYPDKPALAADDMELTFAELNIRANKIANALIDKGVKPNDIVAIKLPRNGRLICALWGIIKSGAAFLPIDTEYPADRVEYVLADSKARFLITDRCEGRENEIILDDLFEYDNSENPVTALTADDLCYVIYTSGSTGKPKGVQICHKNVSNYALPLKYNEFVRCICDECSASLAICTVAFDIFCCEVFTVTLNGKLFVFAGEDDVNNGGLVGRLIDKYKVEVMQFTPSRLLQFMEDAIFLKSLRHMKLMVVGAEVFPKTLAERLKKYTDAKIFNAYGPTETTIGTTFTEITDTNVTIGKPLTNTQIYITDRCSKLLPIGVTGELCIAGNGVGAGYLNNPALTAEKFTVNPFGKGLLYHTGDLAKWSANGEVIYAGRIDDQVKLNGLRIELGEIETKISEFPSITGCTVLVCDGKFLCGYYTADTEIDLSALKAALSKSLVYYMIPKAFVKLDKIPVTLNGKVDKKNLPKPDTASMISLNTDYEAPTNDKERIICAVFAEVLKAEHVGISDNFFRLGGDSIKGIQAASKLLSKGYRLQMRQLFKTPTVKELAPFVVSAKAVFSNDEVSGAVPFTPVQHFFFSQNFEEQNRWNQSVTLEYIGKLSIIEVRNALNKVIAHHDALRAVFIPNSAGQYEQFFRKFSDGELYYRLLETESSQAEALKEELSKTLEISSAPLIAALIIHGEETDSLFITIHHLLTDGVTWRIVIEDLETALNAEKNHEQCTLPNKTSSYKDWANSLIKYSQSSAIKREAGYWNDMSLQKPDELPTDKRLKGKRYNKDLSSVAISLDSSLTEDLLRHTAEAFHTETNDILLTALAVSLKNVFGCHKTTVLLEGHGRENIDESIDISRTAGWFTSTYPINIVCGENIENALVENKEAIRRIPAHGIGFDIIRYLVSPNGNYPVPEIQFNFLGEFMADGSDSTKHGFTKMNFGSQFDISPKSTNESKLQVSGIVTEGKLRLNFTYSAKEYNAKTIRTLSVSYKEALTEIVNRCKSTVKNPVYTPSDLGFTGLSFADFDTVLSVSGKSPCELESLYPLSNLQESMLLISQSYKDEAYYHEQVMYTLSGEVDTDMIARNLEVVTNRYEVLRTSFVFKNVKQPVQVVAKLAKTNFFYKDITNLNEAVQRVFLSGLMTADRITSFDVENAPLFRIKLFKLGEGKYSALISFSHIILDKWSLDIILKEIFANSEYSVKPPLYREYIDWLQMQDKDEAEKYWRELLSDFNSKVMLPVERTGEKGFAQGFKTLHIDEAITEKISAICNNYGVTPASFVQCIWAELLMEYNGTNDTVFGYTLSGRPAQIERVGEIVGMFINTLPVRIKREDTFETMLKAVHKQLPESERYMYLTIGAIQKAVKAKRMLFNHFLTFQNTPDSGTDNSNGNSEISGAGGYNRSIHEFSVSITMTKTLDISFNYNSRAYTEESIDELCKKCLDTISRNLNA